MRTQVPSLVSLSGLRNQHCHELWFRSQTRLGSGIADRTPSLRTSICQGCSPKRQKKKKKKKPKDPQAQNLWSPKTQGFSPLLPARRALKRGRREVFCEAQLPSGLRRALGKQGSSGCCFCRGFKRSRCWELLCLEGILELGIPGERWE